jgi:uncharacterized protein (UPF0332 family)
MSLAKDLLDQANRLARREKSKPKQASLRRAVSTAYYALFHLLIAEATGNWKRTDQRAKLARAFEHGRMKQASIKTLGQIKAPSDNLSRQDPQKVSKLNTVADASTRLQDFRNKADCDNSFTLTPIEALRQIALASDAFASWHSIRKETVAQDYLLALLIHR